MSTPIGSPVDLFHRELRTLLHVELTLAEVLLPELAVRTGDGPTRSALERHREETERHVETLGRVFELTAAAPRPVASRALEGLRDERDEDLKRHDDEDPLVRDLIDLAAVVKVEHLEIASYEMLIAIARGFAEPTVAALLRASLADEEAALASAASALAQLARAR